MLCGHDLNIIYLQCSLGFVLSYIPVYTHSSLCYFNLTVLVTSISKVFPFLAS